MPQTTPPSASDGQCTPAETDTQGLSSITSSAQAPAMRRATRQDRGAAGIETRTQIHNTSPPAIQLLIAWPLGKLADSNPARGSRNSTDVRGRSTASLSSACSASPPSSEIATSAILGRRPRRNSRASSPSASKAIVRPAAGVDPTARMKSRPSRPRASCACIQLPTPRSPGNRSASPAQRESVMAPISNAVGSSAQPHQCPVQRRSRIPHSRSSRGPMPRKNAAHPAH